MKKFIIAMLLVTAVCTSAMAGSLAFDLKVIKFNFQGDICAVSLLDMTHDSAVLTGGETTIGSIPINDRTKLDLSIGVVSSAERSSVPFASIGYNWDVVSSSFLTKIGLDNLRAGVGVGYDFNTVSTNYKDHVVGGIKLSTALLKM